MTTFPCPFCHGIFAPSEDAVTVLIEACAEGMNEGDLYADAHFYAAANYWRDVCEAHRTGDRDYLAGWVFA